MGKGAQLCRLFTEKQHVAHVILETLNNKSTAGIHELGTFRARTPSNTT